jgi:hypothetical protein
VNTESVNGPGPNVTDAYKEGDNRFTGKIHKVTIDLK